MSATLHPLSRPQRLVGAATTLIAMALLAFAVVRPMQQAAAPAPEVISFAAIEPDTTSVILPTVPLEKIDLPLPIAMVNLPEFEMPVEATALPSLAPIISPDAPPRPSGNEILFATSNGTSRANGAGSTMIPPVRWDMSDAPFRVSARKAGLVTSLNFCVTDRGRVRDVKLAATSGSDDMDTTAIRWLERQRFKSGTLDGIPARMCATYDVRWIHSRATRAEAQAAANAHASAIKRRSRYPRQFIYWPHDRPFPGCDALDICEKNLP
jgi:hypothetical protein